MNGGGARNARDQPQLRFRERIAALELGLETCASFRSLRDQGQHRIPAGRSGNSIADIKLDYF
jgi:hypothetical protein